MLSFCCFIRMCLKSRNSILCCVPGWLSFQVVDVLSSICILTTPAGWLASLCKRHHNAVLAHYVSDVIGDCIKGILRQAGILVELISALVIR